MVQVRGALIDGGLQQKALQILLGDQALQFMEGSNGDLEVVSI